MTDYVLPSLKPDITTKNARPDQFAGEYQINPTESILIEVKDNTLYATDPAGVIFRLIRQSTFNYMTEDRSREIHFIQDESGTIVLAAVYVNGQIVETLVKQ